jgi:hypothetical protein
MRRALTLAEVESATIGAIATIKMLTTATATSDSSIENPDSWSLVLLRFARKFSRYKAIALYLLLL